MSAEYREIHRLHAMIDEANIPHDFHPLYDGYTIQYPHGGEDVKCSVIEHKWSYGKQDDKLEICGLLAPEEDDIDHVLGWLTAEDVFERIKKDYEEDEQ